MNDQDRIALFNALAHGDADHCAWLREAIDAHFDCRPVPPPRGKGRKEARIAELEAQLALLTTPPPAGDVRPFAYAYRYPAFPPEGATVIRFGTEGRKINGSNPIETIPLYTHPEPFAAKTAGDVVETVAQQFRGRFGEVGAPWESIVQSIAEALGAFASARLNERVDYVIKMARQYEAALIRVPDAIHGAGERLEQAKLELTAALDASQPAPAGDVEDLRNTITLILDANYHTAISKARSTADRIIEALEQAGRLSATAALSGKPSALDADVERVAHAICDEMDRQDIVFDDFSPVLNATALATAALDASPLGRLRELLEIIVLNARLVPDPTMDGMTDCYAVPIDDINDAEAVLKHLKQEEAKSRERGGSNVTPSDQ